MENNTYRNPYLIMVPEKCYTGSRSAIVWRKNQVQWMVKTCLWGQNGNKGWLRQVSKHSLLWTQERLLQRFWGRRTLVSEGSEKPMLTGYDQQRKGMPQVQWETKTLPVNQSCIDSHRQRFRFHWKYRRHGKLQTRVSTGNMVMWPWW